MKYIFAWITPLVVLISLLSSDYATFVAPIVLFVFVPLLDSLLPLGTTNFSSEEENLHRNSVFYDFLLWLNVPIQYGLLFLYLYEVTFLPHTPLSIIGKTLAMGIACGTIGINVAHELGHRTNRFEQILAKLLLLSSLYMHFIIEHNRGHHKYVATPADPATARYGEIVYLFWVRSIVQSVVSAWNIEAARLQKEGKNPFSLHNEMLQFMVIQVTFTAAIGYFLGSTALILFIIVAIVGILLLETVNYIEHYGLLRKEIQPNIYERVLPIHSWNSDHQIGRIILFELTRHADHHYLASRKYQILRHFDHSPQMPAGYPAMVILALFPPIWLWVMDRQLQKYNLLPTQS